MMCVLLPWKRIFYSIISTLGCIKILNKTTVKHLCASQMYVIIDPAHIIPEYSGYYCWKSRPGRSIRWRLLCFSVDVTETRRCHRSHRNHLRRLHQTQLCADALFHLQETHRRNCALSLGHQCWKWQNLCYYPKIFRRRLCGLTWPCVTCRPGGEPGFCFLTLHSIIFMEGHSALATRQNIHCTIVLFSTGSI